VLQLLEWFIMTDREVRGFASKRHKKTDDVSHMAFGTIQSVVKELERSGRNLSKSGKGHRALLRDTLQTAQRIIVKFLDDEPWQRQFVRAVKGKKKGNKTSNRSNWCLEVVAKATGASSRKARQLASKRAAVLKLLREQNVPVKDTATTLKKEGLEKLYAGRRKKKKAMPAPTAASKSSSTSYQEVSLLLWMERSDRQQLLNKEIGTKFTILVSRVKESDGDFQMKGVMAVNGLGEGAEDWAD
jgi:hypothetical protein